MRDPRLPGQPTVLDSDELDLTVIWNADHTNCYISTSDDGIFLNRAQVYALAYALRLPEEF